MKKVTLNTGYSTEPFSPLRRATIDLLEMASKRHMIHALIQADVSTVRSLIRKRHAQRCLPGSLTAYLVYCFANTAAEYPHIHAYKDWRNRLYQFNDVDVSMPVERNVEGRKEVVPCIIRSANLKSVLAIDAEIKVAQQAPLNTNSVSRLIRIYLLFPPFIRRLFFTLMHGFPLLMKKHGGTVMLTVSGMAGNGSSWALPIATHTLNIAVGGIEKKPVEVDGQLKMHEHLCLTLSFDHDIIDGAPAARFIRRFKAMIESGEGLEVN